MNLKPDAWLMFYGFARQKYSIFNWVLNKPLNKVFTNQKECFKNGEEVHKQRHPQNG
jgi:hypothetical protein